MIRKQVMEYILGTMDGVIGAISIMILEMVMENSIILREN